MSEKIRFWCCSFQDYAKSAGRFSMKLDGKMKNWSRKKPIHFGASSDKRMDAGIIIFFNILRGVECYSIRRMKNIEE